MNSHKLIANELDPHNNTNNATRIKLKRIIYEKNIRLLQDSFLISEVRANQILVNIPSHEIHLLEFVPNITSYFLGLVQSRALLKEDISKAIQYIPTYQLADAMNAGEEGYQRDVTPPVQSLYNDNLYLYLSEPLFNLITGLISIRDSLGNNNIQMLFNYFKGLTETQVAKLSWFATDLAKTTKHFSVFYPKDNYDTFREDILSSTRINYYDYPDKIKYMLIPNKLISELAGANTALISLMLSPYERENILSFFDSNNLYNLEFYARQVKDITFVAIQTHRGRNREYIVNSLKSQSHMKAELADQLINKAFIETALNVLPDVSIANPSLITPNEMPAFHQAWSDNKREFERGLESLLKGGALPTLNVTSLSQFNNNGVVELNNFMKLLLPLSVGLLCPLTILLTALLIYRTLRPAPSSSASASRRRLAPYAKFASRRRLAHADLSINASGIEGEKESLTGYVSENEHNSDLEDGTKLHAKEDTSHAYINRI